MNNKFMQRCGLFGPSRLARYGRRRRPTPAAVVAHYREIAHANYEDACISAKALDKAINAFLAAPSEDGLKAARAAWKAARPSYQQTEALSLRQSGRR